MKARHLAGSMCRFAVQRALDMPCWNISALARASAVTVTASSRSIQVHLHRSLVPSGLPRHLYCPFFGGTYRYRPDLAVADRADFELMLPALGLPAAH